MSEFGQSLNSILGTTKRRFFWMVRQAERLQSARDLRTLHILMVAGNGSQESYDETRKSLEQDKGIVYEFGAFVPSKMVLTEEGLDPEFDREGLRALKAKHGV